MTTVAALASIAALVAEPARAAMLVSLMDGRALTAGELGAAAGVAPPTASGHLGQMLGAGLLALERQGKHRYYRIAGPAIASMLEGLMSLSGELEAARPKPVVTGPRDHAMRRARLCYDHLAGELAVGVADALTARQLVEFGPDGGAVTEPGLAFLRAFGADCAPGPRRAAFCRPCLDWSERRPHIAGRVGRALYTAFETNDWVRRQTAGRTVTITPNGAAAFRRLFDLAT